IIINGEGNGIFCKGRDSIRIENNVILNPGYSQGPGSGQYGIYLNIENDEAKSLVVNNNLISNPRYQAFHARLGSGVSEAIFANNLISYNDSLQGDENELVSIPLGALTLDRENHINQADQLDKYYWLKDSLDQRKNGFTSDRGVWLDGMLEIDFYDRPRNPSISLPDIGPFEYQDSSTGIRNLEHTPSCAQFQKEIFKELLAPENLVFSLTGTEITLEERTKTAAGIYIVVNPETGCRGLIYK
ncbi:MAG: right-handed parallel beta-helix repeat-containing protein, partial [Luteibaculum sp.]